jgi:hypothetical protein
MPDNYVTYNNANTVLTAFANAINDSKNGSFYGTCDTAGDVSAKVVTLADSTGWDLKAGTIIGVKFAYTNSASNVTLNVNGTGAKGIWYNTSVYNADSVNVCGYSDRVNFYIYDGSNYWIWLGMGAYDGNDRVRQTADDSSNSAFEVLFSATADNTTRTEGSKKSSKLSFNPSTGNLSASKFNGAETVYSLPVSCLAGDTYCTIQDSHILTTSIIEDYSENASGTKINVSSITVTTGQVVLNFDALSVDTDFMVKIINI